MIAISFDVQIPKQINRLDALFKFFVQDIEINKAKYGLRLKIKKF